MSNQIRPKYEDLGVNEAQILEISVESAVERFTWVVLKDDDVMAQGTVDRGDTEEFSITVGGSPEKQTSRDEGEGTPHRTMERPEGLPPGDYGVRLYQGAPPKRATTFEAMFGKLVLLDQDAFSVTLGSRRRDAADHATDIGEAFKVELVRGGPAPVSMRTSSVTFKKFERFLAREFREGNYQESRTWPTFGSEPYRAVRDAAREFVATARIRRFEDLVPQGYLEEKLDETGRAFPKVVLPRRDDDDEGAEPIYLPGVELIWNYWLEQGGLVQALHVILARFQNRRIRGRDPLDRFDVTPLLPLRNKLWGYAEDEVHRMTVRRRAVEYEYEYGLSLIGRAVPRPSTVVERRHGFLEAFHQVLFLAHRYFKELDDLTVQADAFPLYRALRDCHIVLSQGTQNQYGEMAVAARAEFLVMQSILAEPQMREFLGGRPMTPYPERWMDRVDAMKSIQGWTDVSIMHFNDLAVIGEQLVLTIRLGSWADTGVDGTHAATWAQAFRPAIQQYAAAYRTATGVDLSREPNAQSPAILLARRAPGGRVRA